MPEDDEGDDDGLSLDAMQIKKFMKLGASRELTFAFVPGAGEEEPLFTIHRRKKPDNLGKAARKEADQTKVGYGTMTVEGKTLILSCDKSVPSMGKKLKKMLRQMKVPFDVKLTDADGNEIA